MDISPSLASTNERLQKLSRQLGAALSSRSWMLVTAESCTGGGIAAAITDIEGSSQWFERGFVTYSNQFKQEMLGVSKSTLAEKGAGSESIVTEMTAGALASSRAQIAVAVSGIAGPAGGTPDKPVGMVCLAWQILGEKPVSKIEYFKGDRAAIRHQAIESALRGLLEMLPVAGKSSALTRS